jgi:hypothetical protein
MGNDRHNRDGRDDRDDRDDRDRRAGRRHRATMPLNEKEKRMRGFHKVLLGMVLLYTGVAVAAGTPPAATLAMTPAAAAVFTPLQPTPAAGTLCQKLPITTCNSCFDFGVTSSYQCILFCVNGVPHQSCGTCGDGCPD